MPDKVQLQVSNGVATIFINNPPLNVVTLELTRNLRDMLKKVEADPQVRAVILTGVGKKAFCAGSDIKEFRSLMETGKVIEEKLSLENYVYDMVERLSKPTIAAINGVALGGGAELALCCDLRVMDEETQIGFPECKLGVFPGSGGTQRLPRLIGVARAKELMYMGDSIGAEEALRIGLINRAAPTGKALEVAMSMATSIALRSGKALEFIKQAVDYGLSAGFAAGQAKTLELSDQIFQSEDLQEGVAAFFSKRQPRFNHR